MINIHIDFLCEFSGDKLMMLLITWSYDTHQPGLPMDCTIVALSNPLSRGSIFFFTISRFNLRNQCWLMVKAQVVLIKSAVSILFHMFSRYLPLEMGDLPVLPTDVIHALLNSVVLNGMTWLLELVAYIIWILTVSIHYILELVTYIYIYLYHVHFILLDC